MVLFCWQMKAPSASVMQPLPTSLQTFDSISIHISLLPLVAAVLPGVPSHFAWGCL